VQATRHAEEQEADSQERCHVNGKELLYGQVLVAEKSAQSGINQKGDDENDNQACQGSFLIF
jgi:hypothetical protein